LAQFVIANLTIGATTMGTGGVHSLLFSVANYMDSLARAVVKSSQILSHHFHSMLSPQAENN